MRKVYVRAIFITLTLMLLKSHQGLLDSLSNFFVDGVVPFTHWSLSGFWEIIAIGSMVWAIYRAIVNLRFSMLKRRALLYQEQLTHRQRTATLSHTTPVISTAEAEDLELAQTSI